jgi:hypothetical protein
VRSRIFALKKQRHYHGWNAGTTKGGSSMHYLFAAGRAVGPFIILVFSSVALAQSFNPVTAETRSAAMDLLDEAEFALSSGDLVEAYRLVEEAAYVPTERHGDGLAVLSARTLGTEVYGRLFDLRYRVRTAMGKKAEEGGLIEGTVAGPRDRTADFNSGNALQWYLDAANADELLRVIRTAPEDRRIFEYLGSASYDDDGDATFTMGSIGSYRYGEPLNGFEPLPRERAIEARFRNEVIPLYLERLRSIANGHLAREEAHFTSPLTDLEKQYSAENWQDIQEAVTGVEAEEQAPIEVRRKMMRTGDSKKILREAKAWFELMRDRSAMAPLRARAAERGETFMAIGNDISMPVLTRSDAYDEAGDYFYIGDHKARSEAAGDLYMAMAPQIEAYEAKRNAMMEEAGERMRAEAELVEQSIEDMEKSEEEKAEFEEEANALEDELGF